MARVNARRAEQDVQGLRALPSDRGEGTIDIGGSGPRSDLYRDYSQAQQGGCRLSVPESTKACVRRVMQDSNARYRRNGLLEEFETFSDEIAVLVRQPCDLSTRARQTGNQPEANRVGIGDKDDGDRAARFPGSIDLRGLATMHYKDIDLETDQFLRQGGVPFQPSPDMSLLAQFPTAQHLANANPRAIRRAAADAGARGFSLDDATVVRDRARRSLYSGKAAAARAHVVRTLVSQLERLTSAIDEVDHAATALLPPSEPGTGPSDAELLQTIPGIGLQTAATLLGELGALTRFTDARALVVYVGFYPVIHESGDRAATPRLSRVGSRIARRSLYLAVVNAVRRSGEWRTICLRKKAQGQTAKQALVVVAVKLLHAVYAMPKHRQPYNPSRLLVAPATMGS